MKSRAGLASAQKKEAVAEANGGVTGGHLHDEPEDMGHAHENGHDGDASVSAASDDPHHEGTSSDDIVVHEPEAMEEHADIVGHETSGGEEAELSHDAPADASTPPLDSNSHSADEKRFPKELSAVPGADIIDIVQLLETKPRPISIPGNPDDAPEIPDEE